MALQKPKKKKNLDVSQNAEHMLYGIYEKRKNKNITFHENVSELAGS